MSEPREVELKLTASPQDLRRLQRHPLVQSLCERRGQTQRLVSVYFDTDDAALARHGFGLRVRQQGAERVQTVKGDRRAAGGLSDRLEVEGPIASDAPDLAQLPDAALRERLHGIIGDAPLVPIFRTEFQRTRRVLRHAGSEWTLDADQGEIVAGERREPICEVELELRAGEAWRLFEFALQLHDHFDLMPAVRSKAERGHALARDAAPGASMAQRVVFDADATVEQALEAVVSSGLAHFSANADCACQGDDPEGVHQLRVGLRRTRAALAVFAPLLPDDPTRVVRSELRWLGRELGGARDLDVFTREVLAPIEAFRGGDPAFKRLRDEALALRAECYDHAREVLRSPRYARLVLELGAWLGARAWRNQPLSESSARLFAPARAFASELLAKRWRKVRRLARRLEDSDEARHALRIQVKKLRYAAESFRELFPERSAKRTLRRLARVQASLGRVNDVVTAHRILETLLVRLGSERSPGHDAAAGFVEGWTAREASVDRRGAAAACKRLRRFEPFWRD
jgi:inorganic triphosphatase YgiF